MEEDEAAPCEEEQLSRRGAVEEVAAEEGGKSAVGQVEPVEVGEEPVEERRGAEDVFSPSDALADAVTSRLAGWEKLRI